MDDKTIVIENWSPQHQRWAEYEAYLQTAELHHVLAGIAKGEDILAQTHFLSAWQNNQLVGILIFLVQPIGPEMDVPAILGADGNPLTEAKIRAFHVRETVRNQGIGTALQKATLEQAKQLGCYQVRSRSELDKKANYAIKLKLGFAMHPALRTFKDDSTSAGVYWVKKV